MLFVIRNNCNIMLHRFHRIFEERKEEIEAIPLRESSPPTFLSNDLPKPKEMKPKEKEKK